MTLRNMFGLLLLGVAPAALAQTNATPHHLPHLVDYSKPWYPAVARAAQVQGSVSVLLTVQSGQVTDVKILDEEESQRLPRAKGVMDDSITLTTLDYSALPKPPGMLADATLYNLRTWRFAGSVNQQLTVTYTYSMKGRQAEQPKQKVHISKTLGVNISVRPPVLDE